MGKTGIEWTDETWNPIAGCTPVSPGCTHCYAATMARRLEAMGQEKYAGTAERRGSVDVFTGKIAFDEKALLAPLKWKKPRRVFVNSMSDLFHPAVPDWIVDRVWAVMALADRHTYQVLTKRPERMHGYLRNLESIAADHATRTVEGCFTPTQVLNMRMLAGTRLPGGILGQAFNAEWPLPNVWLGTSVEDQQRADERIPSLLEAPAAVRFLSCEPLLGPVNLCSVNRSDGWSIDALAGVYSRQHDEGIDHPGAIEEHDGGPRVDWVIIGGESGSRARQCNLAWVRSIVEQCQGAGVSVFVKQLGSNPMLHTEQSLSINQPGFKMHFESLEIDRTYSFRDKKGGDMAEWPEDLRVRQFPVTEAATV